MKRFMSWDKNSTFPGIGEFIALIDQEDMFGGVLPNQKLIAELDVKTEKKSIQSMSTRSISPISDTL